MRFIHSLIYGLISGLAEFLPVSGQAHQAVLMQMFGIEQRQPILDLMIHVALLFSLITAGRPLFSKVKREHNLSSQVRKGGLRRATSKSLLDLQLVRTAAIPMVMLLLIYLATAKWEQRPSVLAITLLLNGIIIIVPEYMRRGNKGSDMMSAGESVFVGILSGLSAFPGISRVGAGIGSAAICGADRQNSGNWALLLSLPALSAFIVFDVINLFVLGFGSLTFLLFLGYILAALLAFIGGYISVLLLRFVTEYAGLTAFAFYSWGMGFFVFMLYLVT